MEKEITYRPAMQEIFEVEVEAGRENLLTLLLEVLRELSPERL